MATTRNEQSVKSRDPKLGDVVALNYCKWKLYTITKIERSLMPDPTQLGEFYYTLQPVVTKRLKKAKKQRQTAYAADIFVLTGMIAEELLLHHHPMAREYGQQLLAKESTSLPSSRTNKRDT